MIFPKILVVGAAVLLLAPAAPASWLLVCNKGEQTLGLVDPVLGRQIAVVAEDGVTGHEVAASSDGTRAFVPIYGNSGVGKPGTDGHLLRVIDLSTRKIVGTVDFGKGVRPHCAVIGPKNHQLYVTTELENCITEIDPDSLKITGTIPTGQSESHMLCISSDGERGYTANVASGTVSVLDMSARKLITIIPVAPQTQRISISPDDHWVFTADQTKPRMVVVDTSKNTVSGSIPLPATAYGTSPTPDGHWLVAALPPANKVAIIDLASLKVAQTVDVPAAPQEVLVRPDGSEAYVSCDASRQIAVIDTKTWKVSKLIKAGSVADGLAWAGN
jgi:DNA-binding beta-propeller fold protein YncE